jgi:hypothetical protein
LRIRKPGCRLQRDQRAGAGEKFAVHVRVAIDQLCLSAAAEAAAF